MDIERAVAIARERWLADFTPAQQRALEREYRWADRRAMVHAWFGRLVHRFKRVGA